MINEITYYENYDKCLDEIMDQAMRDGIYYEITRDYDSKNAVMILEETYPEIMERWGF